MYNLSPLQPVDYLIIGHITYDITPDGPRLGGTATYAALMAKALGMKVGIVTSWGSELPLGPLREIPIVSFPTDRSTTFENTYTPEGRQQTVSFIAPNLDYYLIPEPWRNTPIVHLGPVVQEVEPALVRHFPSSLLGLTPQGWLRSWNQQGIVQPTEWPEATFMLQQAGAAVISVDDVGGDEKRIEEMASAARILAVTEGTSGASVYWNGDVRHFHAPDVEDVDPTGAGDIFACAFFFRLYNTRDPWESARFATQIASRSVTRPGYDGIPNQEEIDECLIEVL